MASLVVSGNVSGLAQNVDGNVPKLSQAAVKTPPAVTEQVSLPEVSERKKQPETASDLAARMAEKREKERVLAAAEQAHARAQLIARQQAEMQYYRALLRQANSQVQYPDQALRKRLEGTVRVSLQLNREGELLLADTSESSAVSLLDRAALRAAKKAAPYPPVPELLQGENFEFDIPFRFVLARN